MKAAAFTLGIRYSELDDWDFGLYIKGDFYNCLHVLESCFSFLRSVESASGDYSKLLEIRILQLLQESEVDLGITWDNGIFRRKGVELLDKNLVNDPLRWLEIKGYENVATPFRKALTNFLEIEKRPELLSDVITDLYESVEALAKTVTGRDNDLSANQELFISKVEATDPYKRILKEYISYANTFRHGSKEGNQKPQLTEAEVESFLYLTGLFIRLAMFAP